MSKYIFSNLIGAFVFDGKFNLEDSILLKDLKDFENKEKFEEKLSKKHKDLKKPNNNELKTILNFFKNKKYYSDFYSKNLQLTKKQIKESVNEDLLIIQAVSNIVEIDKISNILVKRLREWYSLYNPEFVKSIFDNEKFVELILKKTKKESDSMGAELDKKDLDPILSLASQINNLFEFRKNNETYLENLMKKYCPNLNEIAGTLIGAKLLEKAGSLRRLVLMPASTIQILGAEKALFRHLKTKKKAKPPKFGLLFMHPLFSKARRENYGKIARALGDKIAIAVKIDYFKGKFLGDKLKKGLEDKFKQ
jgi:nucleolar protein 56